MKKILSTLALAACLLWAVSASATCSNYTTYSDGQVLTASSLNSLQTNYTNCVNAVLDGDTFTGTLNLQSAADLNIYADTGTTLKASIDGATGTIIGGITSEGYHDNCGISVSGSTWTLAGADGVALSATNPCVTAIRSNTAGRTALAFFTANVTATFGAASDTDGNLFGITDVNWANTMPMFVGEVYDGTTPYWTISRLPYTVTGAAATAVCQKGDTDCDAQLDMMILTTGLTLANWVSLPVTPMGWFDATYATSGGAWTFAVTGKNGFNHNFQSVKFSMPSGQGSTVVAATSKYFVATSGDTPPTWVTTMDVSYYIRQTGEVTVSALFNGTCSAGSGTHGLQLSGPLSSSSSINSIFGNAFVATGAGSTKMTNASLEIDSATNAIQLLNITAVWTNGDFATAGNFLLGSITYPAM